MEEEEGEVSVMHVAPVSCPPFKLPPVSHLRGGWLAGAALLTCPTLQILGSGGGLEKGKQAGRRTGGVTPASCLPHKNEVFF